MKTIVFSHQFCWQRKKGFKRKQIDAKIQSFHINDLKIQCFHVNDLKM